jgi:hypothetical protein
LLRLDICKQSVRFGQLTGIDGCLRVGFQGRNSGIVVGPNQRRRPKSFEPFGDLNELARQALGRNVRLT